MLTLQVNASSGAGCPFLILVLLIAIVIKLIMLMWLPIILILLLSLLFLVITLLHIEIPGSKNKTKHMDIPTSVFLKEMRNFEMNLQYAVKKREIWVRRLQYELNKQSQKLKLTSPPEHQVHKLNALVQEILRISKIYQSEMDYLHLAQSQLFELQKSYLIEYGMKQTGTKLLLAIDGVESPVLRKLAMDDSYEKESLAILDLIRISVEDLLELENNMDVIVLDQLVPG